MMKNNNAINNVSINNGATASGAKKSVSGLWADYKSRFFAPETITFVKRKVLDESTIKSFVQGIPDEASIQVSGRKVKEVSNLIQREAKTEGFLLGTGFALAIYAAHKIGSTIGEKLAEKSY